MSLGVALNFNATVVEPAKPFQAIEPGWYDAKIDESEMRPTNSGSGAYLKLRFSIIGGKHNNQKVFQNLNLQNPNPTAVEIAQKQLSAICHSMNVLQLQNSAQLHGIPLKIKVKIRKDPTNQYEDSNEIAAYENINADVQMSPAYDNDSLPAGFGAPAAPAGFGGQPVAPAAPAAPAMAAGSQPWQQQPAAPVVPAVPAAPAWANGTATAAPAASQPAAQAAPAGNWTPQQAEESLQAQTATAPWATPAQPEQPQAEQ
nr:MAG TPA: Protein of unknown function (DUF669) [Caudoviricetes sp.]